MKRGSFVKLPSHKQFSYVPRFYDEEKEKREEKFSDKKEEFNIPDAKLGKEKVFKQNIHGSFKSNYQRNIKEKKQSNIRLILVAAALFAIAFYLLYI